jgi:hypothetical protein
MLLAENLTRLEWVLLGTVVLCTVAVASRRLKGPGARAARDSEPNDEENERSETTVARRVANLEVRLHDFSREVEARLEKRAAELDGLVAVADREIARLSDLLKGASAAKDPRGPDVVRFIETPQSEPDGQQSGKKAPGAATGPSAAQTQMICRLHEAGYSVPEIAHIVDRSPETVNTILRAA